MKLLFDVGNTRWKWGLFESLKIIRSGTVEAFNLSPLENELANEIVDEVRISSVGRQESVSCIEQWVAERFQLKPKVAKVKKMHLGLAVAYKNVSNLGVDRWLAMIAARESVKGAFIVVDGGSAVTLDQVDSKGAHLGGLIVPGIGLMKSALFDRTAAVKVDALTLPRNWKLGCDTLPCVENGVGAMFQGFLNQVLTPEENTAIVFTGGDGKQLQELAGGVGEYREHLVLEGLLYI